MMYFFIIQPKINNNLMNYKILNNKFKVVFSNFFDRYSIIGKYQIGPGFSNSAGPGPVSIVVLWSFFLTKKVGPGRVLATTIIMLVKRKKKIFYR